MNSLASAEAMVLPGANSEVAQAVGVADDEGHRHRLAERAAEAEHDAADHADLRCRAAPRATPPPRWSRRGRRRDSLSTGGTSSNTSRMIAAMKGRIMIARMSAGGEDADAEGRALEQGADERASRRASSISERLDVARRRAGRSTKKPHMP